MPPKVKFDREQIIECAFSIVRKDGLSALTARSLSAELGSSVCPIFTMFKNMDEVIGEVIACAKKLYAQYISEGLKRKPAFKGVGEQYIAFACDEPKLFDILFMSKTGEVSSQNILTQIDDNYCNILDSIVEEYKFNIDDAKELYMHMWIYTHGIATLCATKTCVFQVSDISKMLRQVCVSIIRDIKSRGGN